MVPGLWMVSYANFFDYTAKLIKMVEEVVQRKAQMYDAPILMYEAVKRSCCTGNIKDRLYNDCKAHFLSRLQVVEISLEVIMRIKILFPCTEY